MQKQSTLLPPEEFIVCYWLTQDDGFKVQEERAFRYHSKNRHDQAINDCREQLRKEGKRDFFIVSCKYQ